MPLGLPAWAPHSPSPHRHTAAILHSWPHARPPHSLQQLILCLEFFHVVFYSHFHFYRIFNYRSSFSTHIVLSFRINTFSDFNILLLEEVWGSIIGFSRCDRLFHSRIAALLPRNISERERARNSFFIAVCAISLSHSFVLICCSIVRRKGVVCGFTFLLFPSSLTNRRINTIDPIRIHIRSISRITFCLFCATPRTQSLAFQSLPMSFDLLVSPDLSPYR